MSAPPSSTILCGGGTMGSARHQPGAVEDRVDRRADLVDRRHAVDPADQAPAPRRCGRIGAVLARYSAMRVRTVSSLSSARRLNSSSRRRRRSPATFGQLVAVVIALAAVGAGEAAGDAVDQRVLVDLELDDMVELAAALGEQLVERLGLRVGARIAVEDDAAVGVGLVEALAEDLPRRSRRRTACPPPSPPRPAARLGVRP